MKLVDLKCKNCGANLSVDPSSDEVTCNYCKATFKLDDEVTHLKFDNMEQSGYDFEKGRIRAQQEHIRHNYANAVNIKQKNNKKIWLVLAWIFLLPFTATYFIIKSKKLDNKKKIIIVSAIWILVILMGLYNNSENKKLIKNKVTECYSKETYEKLDKYIGVDNIDTIISDSTTCENLVLKDKNNDEIKIEITSDKQLLSIKTENKTYYENK